MHIELEQKSEVERNGRHVTASAAETATHAFATYTDMQHSTALHKTVLLARGDTHPHPYSCPAARPGSPLFSLAYAFGMRYMLSSDEKT